MGTATAWHKVSTLPIRVSLARPLILPSAVQMEGHSPGLSASPASQPAHCNVPLWVEVGGHELAHHGAVLSSQEMAGLRAFSKRQWPPHVPGAVLGLVARGQGYRSPQQPCGPESGTVCL